MEANDDLVKSMNGVLETKIVLGLFVNIHYQKHYFLV